MAEISAKKLKGGRGEKVGRKNLWPQFDRILPKAAEKGQKKIFKRVPCFTVMTNTQRQRQNLILISIFPWAERCTDVSVKLAEHFLRLAELF